MARKKKEVSVKSYHIGVYDAPLTIELDKEKSVTIDNNVCFDLGSKKLRLPLNHSLTDAELKKIKAALNKERPGRFIILDRLS